MMLAITETVHIFTFEHLTICIICVIHFSMFVHQLQSLIRPSYYVHHTNALLIQGSKTCLLCKFSSHIVYLGFLEPGLISEHTPVIKYRHTGS